MLISLCGSGLSSEEKNDIKDKEVFLLQRWSTKWQTFVDVSATEEIISGDKLTVAPKSLMESPKKVREQECIKNCTDVASSV